MRECVLVLTCAAWALIGAGVDVAWAQVRDHIGITMGFPTSVGVLCPLGSAFAIRPELSFSQTAVLTEGPAIGDASVESISTGSTRVVAGVSGLVYVRHWDALRAYVSPRFAYSRTATTMMSTPTPGTPFGSESTTATESSVAGSFGAQYALVRHLGLFGEVGLEYTRSNPAVAGTTGHSHTLGTISSAGLIFFF